jgi:hypothetical protein
MPRRAPTAQCPDPLHVGARVVAWGIESRKQGKVRRYKCHPLVGYPHSFSVGIEGGRRVRGQQGAPPCPQGHTDAHVIRNGSYGKGASRRQRYLCQHQRHNDRCRPECPGWHSFTPVIPRHHVAPGDHCAGCLELRGIHRGEKVVARRHRLTARQAAQLLAAIAAGKSYADAGRDAAKLMKLPLAQRRRAAPAPEVGPPVLFTRSSVAARVWHIGADLVEGFGPIVWEHTLPRLQARAERIAAAGLPRTWIVDDVPVSQADEKKKRWKTGGYSVLVVAEMDPFDEIEPWATRLRLIRALPKANTIAWRFVFDEVGYTPDIVIADGASAIQAAIREQWGPGAVRSVPSLWHLRKSLEEGPLAAAIAGERGRSLRIHLDALLRPKDAEGSVTASPEAWREWWQTLWEMAEKSGLVRMPNLGRSRADTEDRMADAIPILRAWPRLNVLERVGGGADPQGGVADPASPPVRGGGRSPRLAGGG